MLLCGEMLIRLSIWLAQGNTLIEAATKSYFLRTFEFAYIKYIFIPQKHLSKKEKFYRNVLFNISVFETIKLTHVVGWLTYQN